MIQKWPVADFLPWDRDMLGLGYDNVKKIDPFCPCPSDMCNTQEWLIGTCISPLSASQQTGNRTFYFTSPLSSQLHCYFLTLSYLQCLHFRHLKQPPSHLQRLTVIGPCHRELLKPLYLVFEIYSNLSAGATKHRSLPLLLGTSVMIFQHVLSRNIPIFRHNRPTPRVLHCMMSTKTPATPWCISYAQDNTRRWTRLLTKTRLTSQGSIGEAS